MIRIYKLLFPERLRRLIGRHITIRLRRIWYAGDRYHCPCCDKSYRKFLPFGLDTRPHALCPICHSLERHRTYWLYIQQKTNLLTTPQYVLQFAPNPALQVGFSQLEHLTYLTVDLLPINIDAQMDITKLGFSPDTFDVIVCNHVLEHIPDDYAAMRELYRVLKPGGWALLQVPMSSQATTYEDPSIVLPEDRQRAFGQPDHLRLYGHDYTERLESCGFEVRVDTFASDLPPEQRARYRLSAEMLYIGTKTL